MEATKRILAVAVGPQRDTLIQSVGGLSGVRPYIEGLIDGLSRLNRNIGTDYEISYREHPQLDGKSTVAQEAFKSADGKTNDIIFGMSTTVARAAHGATQSTPIVCIVSDLRAEGLSRAKNVTGISGRRSQTAGDCFLRFLATVPTLKQVAVLHKARYGPSERSLKLIKAAASKRGITIKTLAVKSREEIEQKLSALPTRRLSDPATLGVLVLPVDICLSASPSIIEIAQGKKNIPTFYPVPDWVRPRLPSALGAYGVSQRRCGELMAEYTEKILWSNSSPKDLKVKEAPDSMLEWVVSAEAARALNIALPKII
jgi:ABC-type uncharacterized transport system substrate-binding protein